MTRTKAAIAAAALVLAAVASPASAQERCAPVAANQWLPIEKAIERAETLGYAVKEAKRSDGCWEIEGYDRNGAEIEIRFEPASGEVVKSKGWRAPTAR